MVLERRRFVHTGFLGILICAWSCAAWNIQAQAPREVSKTEIKALPLADGLYVLVGTGGNIGVSVGSDGILLVDPQAAAFHEKIMEAVGKLGKQPLRYVVNTHMHADVMGGNELMAKAGAVVIAHDNVRTRLIAQRTSRFKDPKNPPVKDGDLPFLTYTGSMTLHFNGDDIQVVYLNPAHTDGDSLIYFPKANVIFTGDMYGAARYPFMTPEYGGTIMGMIAAEEKILQIANRDTKIIPGKGDPLATSKDVQTLHDAAVTVRDRVRSGIKAGKTVEQVLAFKPTAEFDTKYATGRGPDDFVKALYQELSSK